MNCDDAQATFASHLDGEELPAGEAEALDRHLADCTACRIRAEEAAATHRDLLLLRAVEAGSPASRVEATGRTDGEPEVGPPSAARHPFWIEAAAAVVLAVVMAYLLWPGEEPVGTGPSDRKAADPVAQPASRVGLVSACGGKVERKDGVDAAPVALEPGQDLARGQEIHTARDGFAVLDLSAGPVIRLEGDSVLRIGPPERPACVLLLRGRGRFEVTERDAPWRVQTPNATVETRESVFFVSLHE